MYQSGFGERILGSLGVSIICVVNTEELKAEEKALENTDS